MRSTVICPASPLEQVTLSKKNSNILPRPLFDSADALKGVQSRFRSQHPQMAEYLAQFQGRIDVETDLEHARAFLISYSGSPATFKAYRGYVERLILWSWIVQGKSILDLARSDAEQFMAFNTAPPDEWVGTAVLRRFIKISDDHFVFNERWRPFGIKIAKADRK